MTGKTIERAIACVFWLACGASVFGCATPGTPCDTFEVELEGLTRVDGAWTLQVDEDGWARLKAGRDSNGDRIERSWSIPDEELLELRRAIAREHFYELPSGVGSSQGFCSPVWLLSVKECANSNSILLGYLGADEESRRVEAIWSLAMSWVDARAIEGLRLSDCRRRP